MLVVSRSPRALIASTALGLVACTAATAPTDPALRAFAGTFALQSLDGAPVPVLQEDYSYIRQYLIADTLTADGLGGYTRVQVTRVDSVGPTYSALQRTVWTGAYAVRGDTVDFPVHCPPGAMCINPPVGWRTADGGVVLAYRFTEGFRFVSRFVRVR